MDFQWDETKASRNLGKHGIDFADAVGVFDDLNAITVDDPNPNKQRFITIWEWIALVGFWWWHICGEATPSALSQPEKQSKKNENNMGWAYERRV